MSLILPLAISGVFWLYGRLLITRLPEAKTTPHIWSVSACEPRIQSPDARLEQCRCHLRNRCRSMGHNYVGFTSAVEALLLTSSLPKDVGVEVRIQDSW
jgi:hypothetical protein